MTSSRQYTANGGLRCPVCNSPNLTDGDKEKQHDMMLIDVTCQQCGAEWTDIFQLAGYTGLKKGK